MKQPKLHEDNLHANVDVEYKGKSYVTGNRYGTLVELYIGNYGFGTDGVFFRTVDTKDIKLVETNKIVKGLKRDVKQKRKEINKIKSEIRQWNKFIKKKK